MTKLSYLLVFLALSVPGLYGYKGASLGAEMIGPDQEYPIEGGGIGPDETIEYDEDDSFLRRLLSWVAGDSNSNEGSSLRGGRRGLWSWNTGSGNCRRRFWSSCSSKDKFTTGNSIVGPDPTRPPRPTFAPDKKNIMELLESNEDFEDLVMLLEAAGLTSTLSGGNYTVFAPTNDAFKWFNLDDAKASKDLEKILTYHVVPGVYRAEDLKDNTQLMTIEGQNITIHIPPSGRPTVNCGASITMVDMEAENGVIHTIGWPLNVFKGNKQTCDPKRE